MTLFKMILTKKELTVLKDNLIKSLKLEKTHHSGLSIMQDVLNKIYKLEFKEIQINRGLV